MILFGGHSKMPSRSPSRSTCSRIGKSHPESILGVSLRGRCAWLVSCPSSGGPSHGGWQPETAVGDNEAPPLQPMMMLFLLWVKVSLTCIAAHLLPLPSLLLLPSLIGVDPRKKKNKKPPLINILQLDSSQNQVAGESNLQQVSQEVRPNEACGKEGKKSISDSSLLISVFI